MFKIGQRVIDTSAGRIGVIIDVIPPKGWFLYKCDDRSVHSQYENNLTLDTPKVTSKPHDFNPENKVTKKEGEFSKMNFKSLIGEFGKVRSGEVAMTFDGKVVYRKDPQNYVRYDDATGIITNYMDMVIEAASKLMYIIPVQAVAAGDCIKWKGNFYQITEVKENGSLMAVNLNAGTKSTIYKETNVFFGNFYSKVISLFDGANTTTEGFNPMLLALLSEKGDSSFDSILPLLLMGGDMAKNPMLMFAMMDGKSDMKDIFMMQALTGQAGEAAGAFNPMMLMLMDGKSDMKDMLMLSMMSGQKLF